MVFVWLIDRAVRSVIVLVELFVGLLSVANGVRLVDRFVDLSCGSVC